MEILALETSCDETSAAIVENDREILSNIVSTQVEFHQKYGGIVPEIASRKHIEVISLVIKEAMEKAGRKFKDLDAVVVTYGPGLVGSLLVGLCAAKTLAWSLKIPLIGVNHLEGHIYANFLMTNDQFPITKQTPNSKLQIPNFPFICLIVSGGHTLLVLVKNHGEYQTLGRTRDDAAGEAFDKVARFLGLGYPGGPIIDELAKEGDPTAVDFKRPMIEEEFGYDFSFSGIKTAVIYYVKKQSAVTREQKADIAASFQQAAIDVLVDKTIRAAKEFRCQTITLAGGVSANSLLRQELQKKAQEQGLTVNFPPVEFCTDNAAMIGCAGYYQLKRGKTSDLNLSPVANLRL